LFRKISLGERRVFLNEARSLRTKQTYTIGIVIPDIANNWYAKVLRAVEDAAEQKGYNLILCNSDENPKKEIKYLKVLYGKNVDGVILSTTGGTDTFVRKLIRGGLPLVLIDRKIRNTKATQMLLDNKGVAYDIANHLINVGHERISIVGGLLRTSVGEERLKGYKRALE